MSNNTYYRGRSRGGRGSSGDRGSRRGARERYHNDQPGRPSGGGGSRIFVTLLGVAVLAVLVFSVWMFRDDLTGLLGGASTPTPEPSAMLEATATPTATPTPTPESTPTPTPEPTPTPPTSEEISISVVGDIMAHEPQLTSAYDKDTKTYDFTENYSEITDLLSPADLTMGNLETTLSGADKKYSGYPAFNTPDSILDALKGAGFDLLTTSNNHSQDRGWYGVKRTLETLAEAGIPATGTFLDKDSANTPLIVDVKSTKVAVLAYSYGSNRTIEKSFSMKIIDLPTIKKDIQRAREAGAQVVIVCPHWGAEKARAPSAKMQSQAKSILEYGADAVIGSHPHVLQKIERLEVTREDGSTYNGLVAYSLGNFISNQQFQYQDTGMILNVTFSRDLATNAITVQSAGYVPTWVYLDDEKTYRVLPIARYVDNDELLSTLTAKAKKRIKAAWEETVDLLGEDGATLVR